MIRKIAIISTGLGEGHPEHINGTKKPTMFWVLFSRRWVRMPIYLFVIEHNEGLILFDTGMDRAVATDPDYWPDKVTKFFMNRIFRFHQTEEDTLTNQMKLAGYDVNDVKIAVISHLHFDHIGGIREIPNAELYVSQEAWDHMLGPHTEREGVLRRDIDIPSVKWNKVSFDHRDSDLPSFESSFDLMNDGSIILVPTPGHLPGSISALIRRDEASPILLIGDLAYNPDYIETRRLPGIGEKKELLDSYDRVASLKKSMPDLKIIGSHDINAADLLGD